MPLTQMKFEDEEWIKDLIEDVHNEINDMAIHIVNLINEKMGSAYMIHKIYALDRAAMMFTGELKPGSGTLDGVVEREIPK